MESDRGFRGWLSLFFATTCIGTAMRAFFVYHAALTLWVVVSRHESTEMIAAAASETAIHAGFFAATICGLLLFAKCDARTPTFWGAFLLASPVGVVAVDATVAWQSALAGTRSFGDAFWRLMRAGGLAGIFVSVAWALYWMRARRVKLTFGSNAFERRAESAPSIVPAGQDAPV